MNWGVPTADHLFFIPVVLLFGVFVGYVLGGRAARNELEHKRRRARE